MKDLRAVEFSSRAIGQRRTLDLPESAARVATDPNRVYYVAAGYNLLLPGLLFF